MLTVDGVQIERLSALRGYEISVSLSNESEEGSYTFIITDPAWCKAVARGLARTGREAVDEALPWLIAEKKAVRA